MNSRLSLEFGVSSGFTGCLGFTIRLGLRVVKHIGLC